MHGVVFLRKPRTQVVGKLQIRGRITWRLRRWGGDRNAQALLDVVPRLAVQRRKLPGGSPVQASGQIPRHTPDLRGGVIGLDELVARARPVVFNQRLRRSKDTPQGINVSRPALVCVAEEPGPLVVEHRDAFERRGHRHGDAKQLRQLCRNQLAVGVRHAAVERAHHRERADILQRAAASVRELVLQIAQALHALSHLVDALNERCSVARVGQQLLGDSLVEVRPLEQGAEAVLPVRRVAESLDVLGLAVECEFDQRIRIPFARHNAPDGGAVGVEVPLAHAIRGLPLHFDALAVLWVLGDDADGLDAHDRHRLLTVVERQTVLAHIRGLDGNALTRPHGANQRLLLLAGAADLPDAFFEEAGALVIGVTEAGSDEPRCTGRLVAGLFCHFSPFVIPMRQSNGLDDCDADSRRHRITACIDPALSAPHNRIQHGPSRCSRFRASAPLRGSLFRGACWLVLHLPQAFSSNRRKAVSRSDSLISSCGTSR